MDYLQLRDEVRNLKNIFPDMTDYEAAQVVIELERNLIIGVVSAESNSAGLYKVCVEKYRALISIQSV